MLAEPGGWDTDVRTPRLSGRLHSLEAGLESAWGSWGAGLAGDLAVGGFGFCSCLVALRAVTRRWGDQVGGC